jgi:hypothetical protein
MKITLRCLYTQIKDLYEHHPPSVPQGGDVFSCHTGCDSPTQPVAQAQGIAVLLALYRRWGDPSVGGVPIPSQVFCFPKLTQSANLFCRSASRRVWGSKVKGASAGAEPRAACVHARMRAWRAPTLLPRGGEALRVCDTEPLKFIKPLIITQIGNVPQDAGIRVTVGVLPAVCHLGAGFDPKLAFRPAIYLCIALFIG